MFVHNYFLICFIYPLLVNSCEYEIFTPSGTIEFLNYQNNIQCLWTFHVISSEFRSILFTFRQFDTELGHDELWIGETIPDVSRYNSKMFRFSGSKLPEPFFIGIRDQQLTQSVWIQFTSDQTTTSSGFVLDYVFLFNQCKSNRLFLSIRETTILSFIDSVQQ